MQNVVFTKKRKLWAVILLAMTMLLCYFFGWVSPSWKKVAATDEEDSITAESEINMMRYGFNVTGGKSLLDGGLIFQYPILKPASSGWGEYVAKNTHNAGPSKGESFVGYSATELAQQTGSFTSGGVSAKIAVVNTDVSTQFDRTSTSTTTYAERFETYYQRVLSHAYAIQGNVDLSEYLTDDFKTELYRVKDVPTAKMLLEKYGTHLFKGLEYGGLIQVTSYVKTSSETADITQLDLLSSKIDTAMGKYGGGVSFSFSETFASEEKKTYGTSNYNLFMYGGNAVTGMTLDQLFTYHGSVTGEGQYEYNGWIESINQDVKLAVIGVPAGDYNVAVWDLLPSKGETSIIRNYLVQAYAELCGDEYAEYLKKYPSCSRIIGEDETDAAAADVLGYTAVYNKNTTYCEESSSTVTRNVMPSTEIYMNIANDKIPVGFRNWSIVNGENYVDIVDAASGVFRVKDDASVGKSFMVALRNDQDVISSYSFKIIAASSFSGGQGTEEDPYLIASADDLDALRRNSNYWASHFKLVRNIDLGGIAYAGIGEKTNPFAGSFDGNNCTISNFKLLTPRNGESLGFFAFNAGTVQNLRLDNVTVGKGIDPAESAGHRLAYGEIDEVFAGCLVGYNQGSILNCHITNADIQVCRDRGGRITLAVGTVAGYSSGTIEKCAVENLKNLKVFAHNGSQNNMTVTFVGGLVGWTNNARINNSYVMNGANAWGESVGKTAYVRVGGAVGSAKGATQFNSIAIGKIDQYYVAQSSKDGQATSSGILVGEQDGDVTFTSCYATKNSTATYSLSADKCTQLDTILYSNTSFDTETWCAGKNKFPVLKCQQFNADSVLDINTDNATTSFYYGQAFNITGVTVEARYADANSEPFAVDSFTYNAEAYDAETIGDHEIIIEAMGYLAKYTVSVRKIRVVALEIKPCDDVKFYVGEKVKTADFTVSYVLEDGRRIAPTADKESSIEYPKVDITLDEVKYVKGQNRVVANCGKLETSVVVTAEEKALDHLEIIAQPNKLTYYENEMFDMTGLQVMAFYSDGSSMAVDNKNLEVIGGRIAVGSNKVLVAYDSYKTVTLDVTGKEQEVTYTVTFQNWDGSVLSTQKYKHGDIIVMPTTPTRAADANYTYVFTGWTPAVSGTCTGEAVYQAKFEAVPIPVQGETQTYVVIFLDWNDVLLSMAQYSAGATIVVPANPVRASDDQFDYTFSGWDKPLSTVCTATVTYKAVYTATPREVVDSSENTSETVSESFSETVSESFSETVSENVSSNNDGGNNDGGNNGGGNNGGCGGALMGTGAMFGVLALVAGFVALKKKKGN